MPKAVKHILTAVPSTEKFANEFKANGEVGDIYAAFGVYPYGEAQTPDGKTKFIIQQFDEASAKAIKDQMPKEGYPIYAGHPDVEDVASKYPNKAAIGWTKAIEVTKAGVRFVVDWLQNPGKGFKWFSPFWDAEVDDNSANSGESTLMAHVNSLTSIGLVNNPRIESFRLANEWSVAPNAQAQKQEEKIMNDVLKKLAEALGLDPNTATPEQIVAAVSAMKAKQAEQEGVEMENGKMKAACAAADAAKKLACENEAKMKAACANERKARITLMLDNAIRDGKVTPATRSGWEAKFANEADFDKTVLELANAAPVVHVNPIVTPTPEGGDHHGKVDLVSLANERARKDGITFTDAWLKVKAEKPELFK